MSISSTCTSSFFYEENLLLRTDVASSESRSSQEQLNCLMSWVESEASVDIAGVSATVSLCGVDIAGDSGKSMWCGHCWSVCHGMSMCTW